VEDQRLAARALEVDDLADDQVVVAGDVDAHHLAAQDGEGVHDRDVAGRVDDRVARRERRAGLGERERDVTLAPVKDVHGVVAAAAHHLERSRPVGQRDEHQQRVERHRRERVERHAGVGVADAAGDDGDPGGECADDFAEVEPEPGIVFHVGDHMPASPTAQTCVNGVRPLVFTGCPALPVRQ